SETSAEPAAENASKSADLEERKIKALEKAAAIKAARAKAEEEAAGAGQAKETSADKNKGEQ
uniref:hypothetical protein n=1 Tax=Ruminobacter amylophilus TaxID=867 RepID=UPI00386468AE